MVVPPLDKVYGLNINVEVFNEECVEFIGKDSFVIGKIKTKQTYSIWKKIREQIIASTSEAEWVQRNKELYENRIKKRKRNGVKA